MLPMIRPLIVYPDPMLKEPSQEVFITPENKAELEALIQDMYETMRTNRGMGLSAVQVGVLQRVMTATFNKVDLYMLNPVILDSSERDVRGLEGCLSFPKIVAEVKRPDWVRVEYMMLDGEIKEETYRDYEARCIVHEIDHMNGEVFIDKMEEHRKFFLKGALNSLEANYKPRTPGENNQ